MRNIKLTLEYDGSRYNGWQRLGRDDNSGTIETKLLEVIKKMSGENAELNCAARTETGVHAHGQVVNFKTSSPMKLYEIKNYFNRYLPMDIAVIDIQEMPERFHASLNVKSVTYLYRISIGDVPSVFERKYMYYSFQKPDVDKMHIAAQSLLGKHDFKCFSTVKKAKSTVKEITAIEIYGDENEIQITINANQFLHNMARMIIGTLLDVGCANRPLSDVEQILSGKNGMISSAPAKALGLFLEEVGY
ncbi:MAG: tRNA pseudouridine(38-40) synthase TruA [Lachnospiraceae bacterium]|nr:tRNA pseudouridine(38-40) synthase TruA [Lachnospiraceae bacterium]